MADDDDVSKDDMQNAFIDAMRTRGGPYNDAPPPTTVPMAPWIAQQVSPKNQYPDEDFVETIRKGPSNRILDANDSLSGDIQTDPNVEAQTPLDKLIPKIASGKHTKQEMMDFLNLTGTPL